MQLRVSKPTAIDVFAGGGGLTVGLKRAGFNVVSAIENEPHAFATYKANHPEVKCFKQDVRTIKGSDFSNLLPAGLDVLAGCPPCQGFTSLTSKYRRQDDRNQLIREMARLVEELEPRAIMMENVPGLVAKGKLLFDEFLECLARNGYVVRYKVLQVADYGVPQNRRRLVLMAGRGFEIPIPQPTHSKNGSKTLKKWKTVRSAIGRMPKAIEMREAHRLGGPARAQWHVVRSMSTENQKRIRHAVAGAHWRKIPKSLRPNCHQDSKAGFQNVYGRMAWDRESPTITGGCTTLSKGRFGHPEQNRTISVLEAARLQTFPRDYIFDTPFMEYVCSIIGNALPCDFAEALARECAARLPARKRTKSSKKFDSRVLRSMDKPKGSKSAERGRHG